MVIDDRKESLKIQFKKELEWFEAEMDELFKGKSMEDISEEELYTANVIFDQLSREINKYREEKFLSLLVDKLNSLERKYPFLF